MTDWIEVKTWVKSQRKFQAKWVIYKWKSTVYQPIAPKLADWLEKNAPEAMTVFSLPENHRRRMRTSNPMERATQQEIKRRTQKVRVFPDEASLTRLISAVRVEIDD